MTALALEQCCLSSIVIGMPVLDVQVDMFKARYLTVSPVAAVFAVSRRTHGLRHGLESSMGLRQTPYSRTVPFALEVLQIPLEKSDGNKIR